MVISSRLDIIYYFGFNYKQLNHYLDAEMNQINIFEDASSETQTDTYGFTNLKEDLLLRIWIYVGSTDGVPIVFDSGCSIAATPN